MKGLFFLFTLIMGIAIGVAGTYLAPDLIGPYLPEAIVGKSVIIEGKVVEKQLKQTSLLLTINTSEGALLATFKKRVEEIGLLVNEGDLVDLLLRRYEPFVENPGIKRVRKGEGPMPIQPEETTLEQPPSEERAIEQVETEGLMPPLPPPEESDQPPPSSEEETHPPEQAVSEETASSEGDEVQDPSLMEGKNP
jgi:hypothetical protein